MHYTDEDYARLYNEAQKPRALSLREFLLLAALAAALGFLLGCDAADAEVTAKLEAEARDRKAMRPEACISQYGSGERWLSQTSSSSGCASAARAVPNHVLTMPIVEGQ